MPVIKSARKKLKVDRKRESANKKLSSLVEISIKKAKRKPTPKSVQEAFSIIDKGVKKNIIHKNKASRIKSRLSKLIRGKAKTRSETARLVKVKKAKKSEK